MAEPEIKNVSDTSLWVAHYRALETERPDALFRDPLAKVLIGDRGRQIAESFGDVGRYTEWQVVTRTVVIDGYIQDLLKEGVDAVVNLGAGMDTRPYRMDLPPTLEWFEVDYPHIVALKNEKLSNEKPRCRLTRVAVDLADDDRRRTFLRDVGSKAKKILVLTEGVVPYLSPEQVAALAKDLNAVESLRFWIAEYFDPKVYKHLKARLRTQKMQNAPFRFYPPDWFGFFSNLGWEKRAIRYSGIVAIENGRTMPMPLWARMIVRLFPKKWTESALKMTGYAIFEKKN